MAVVALAVGLAGLAASLVGVVTELLPRQFTAGQQRAIMSWETAGRWRTEPAGQIFPARVRYAPPAVLRFGTLRYLTARRIGIAPQGSCSTGTDRGASTVLMRHGCEALLRASYSDATDSYVLTVGVAVLPGKAQALAAGHALAGHAVPWHALAGHALPAHARPARFAHARSKRSARSARARSAGVSGVLAARFTGTVSAGFGDARRQLLGSFSEGPYVVLYAIGYTDDRPRVPVADDHYADAEMSALGLGVARFVGTRLGAPPPAPSCPGAPGC